MIEQLIAIQREVTALQRWHDQLANTRKAQLRFHRKALMARFDSRLGELVEKDLATT